MGELRTRAVRTVHVVVPAGIDDPARPSGGNVYDRRVCTGLREAGWRVMEHEVPGDWPRPDAPANAALAAALRRAPDGGVVLIDGLIASTAPDVLEPHAGRLRQVVLMHMPLGGAPEARAREARTLGCAAAVVTTSEWTRRHLLERYAVDAAGCTSRCPAWTGPLPPRAPPAAERSCASRP